VGTALKKSVQKLQQPAKRFSAKTVETSGETHETY
jgi:hypothetical protein